MRTTRPNQRALERIERSDRPFTRERGRHNRLGQSWGVRLGLLGRRYLCVARITAELNMAAFAVRAKASAAFALARGKLAKVGVLTTDESKSGGLLLRPTKSTLVDLHEDHAALGEDLSQLPVVPHVASRRLLKPGQRIGLSAVSENGNGRVQTPVPELQRSIIDGTELFAPGIMLHPARPLL